MDFTASSLTRAKCHEVRACMKEYDLQPSGGRGAVEDLVFYTPVCSWLAWARSQNDPPEDALKAVFGEQSDLDRPHFMERCLDQNFPRANIIGAAFDGVKNLLKQPNMSSDHWRISTQHLTGLAKVHAIFFPQTPAWHDLREFTTRRFIWRLRKRMDVSLLKAWRDLVDPGSRGTLLHGQFMKPMPSHGLFNDASDVCKAVGCNKTMSRRICVGDLDPSLGQKLKEFALALFEACGPAPQEAFERLINYPKASVDFIPLSRMEERLKTCGMYFEGAMELFKDVACVKGLVWKEGFVYLWKASGMAHLAAQADPSWRLLINNGIENYGSIKIFVDAIFRVAAKSGPVVESDAPSAPPEMKDRLDDFAELGRALRLLKIPRALIDFVVNEFCRPNRFEITKAAFTEWLKQPMAAVIESATAESEAKTDAPSTAPVENKQDATTGGGTPAGTGNDDSSTPTDDSKQTAETEGGEATPEAEKDASPAPANEVKEEDAAAN